MARSSDQDSIFELIGRLCATSMKPRLRIIYLTTHITGKSRAMTINGDGTLIAGILEINLFRQRTRTQSPPARRSRTRVYARLCERKSGVIDDCRGRGFT